jgi:hypothetical protein
VIGITVPLRKNAKSTALVMRNPELATIKSFLAVLANLERGSM